ncbi:MAG: putative polyadenylate-binding protein RBP47, partial [Streblomastix strix]
MTAQDKGQGSTIYIGDLDAEWDEFFLQTVLPDPEIVQIKVIRDKNTGRSSCYGFLECTSSFAAQNIMAKYNQKRIPNTNRTFKLNWASYSSGKADNDYALYVGDLPSMVTDTILFQTFFAKFPSCKQAKVITDPQTGQSKNYGFVRFNTPEDFKSAIVRMNGQLCMGQPMRIRAATSTKRNAEMRGERELAEIESLVASQGGTVGYQFGEGRD